MSKFDDVLSRYEMAVEREAVKSYEVNRYGNIINSIMDGARYHGIAVLGKTIPDVDEVKDVSICVDMILSKVEPVKDTLVGTSYKELVKVSNTLNNFLIRNEKEGN